MNERRRRDYPKNSFVLFALNESKTKQKTTRIKPDKNRTLKAEFMLRSSQYLFAGMEQGGKVDSFKGLKNLSLSSINANCRVKKRKSSIFMNVLENGT